MNQYKVIGPYNYDSVTISKSKWPQSGDGKLMSTPVSCLF